MCVSEGSRVGPQRAPHPGDCDPRRRRDWRAGSAWKGTGCPGPSGAVPGLRPQRARAQCPPGSWGRAHRVRDGEGPASRELGRGCPRAAAAGKGQRPHPAGASEAQAGPRPETTYWPAPDHPSRWRWPRRLGPPPSPEAPRGPAPGSGRRHSTGGLGAVRSLPQPPRVVGATPPASP